MNIRKNATATKIYTAIENAEIIADFSLDLLAAAIRTGMDIYTAQFEALRISAAIRISDLAELFDHVARPERTEAYLARYNEIMDAA